MNTWPLRFRDLEDGSIFLANDAGGYFVSNRDFIDRYAHNRLTELDHAFLLEQGHSYGRTHDLQYTAFAWRYTARQTSQGRLSYIILVPTLRCNLACTYCQVSRANEAASGYDWTDVVVEDVLRFLDKLATSNVKIEFQGGEPLLRIDLLERVRKFCRKRFDKSEFVVCTNLQNLPPEALAFFDSDDTFISTSLDGKVSDHNRQRTQDNALVATFFSNLANVISLCGIKRVSALSTIDIDSPPDLDALIETYVSFGFSSIYVRPVNYQGFARRRPPKHDDLAIWCDIYGKFIDRLVEHNSRTGHVIEEFYLTHCLRRLLQPGHDGHVDLRNPSLPATDYIVIDFDGRLYPSDEARMLSRIGHVDFSVGNISDGLDHTKIATLSASALNNFDPDCIHCPYQPFCGSDPVDDVSRYGRIDIPRADTWFCGRQLSIFDLAVKLIYSNDEKVQFSLKSWIGLSSWPPALAPVHQ